MLVNSFLSLRILELHIHPQIYPAKDIWDCVLKFPSLIYVSLGLDFYYPDEIESHLFDVNEEQQRKSTKTLRSFSLRT